MQEHFIYQDDDGSIVITYSGKIVLNLKSENRSRNIGVLAKDGKGGISYYKEDKESEIFRKTDSWSLNYNVIKFLEENATINIKTEKFIYRISKSDVIEKGEFLYFKTSGIEKKIYVKRDFFSKEQY